MKNLLSKLFVGFGKVRFIVTVKGEDGSWSNLPLLSVVIIIINKITDCDNNDDLRGQLLFEKSGKIYSISLVGGVIKDQEKLK